tara:strand:- start:412 stop:1002 length:591 start_codon:yes stop_codon:yes gene_type:complete
MEFFGKFDWPTFVGLMPQYIAAVATVSAVLVAYIQIRGARKEASERDALKSLDDMSSSLEWQRVRTEFVYLRKQLDFKVISYTDFIQKVVDRDYQDEDFKNVFQAFRAVMNNYELTAIGIRRGAFSEAIYKDFRRGVLIHDWKVMLPVVEAIRKQEKNKKVFEHMEWLVARWSEDEKNADSIEAQSETIEEEQDQN